MWSGWRLPLWLAAYRDEMDYTTLTLTLAGHALLTCMLCALSLAGCCVGSRWGPAGGAGPWRRRRRRWRRPGVRFQAGLLGTSKERNGS
jgi:hypothetical protein